MLAAITEEHRNLWPLESQPPTFCMDSETLPPHRVDRQLPVTLVISIIRAGVRKSNPNSADAPPIFRHNRCRWPCWMNASGPWRLRRNSLNNEARPVCAGRALLPTHCHCSCNDALRGIYTCRLLAAEELFFLGASDAVGEWRLRLECRRDFLAPFTWCL